MKKLLFILLVAGLPYAASAQTDSTSRKPKIEYCMLVAKGWGFFNEFSVRVDAGRTRKAPLDTYGRELKFDSVVDGLNYMVEQGWELVNSYAFRDSRYENSTVNYVMQRKVE